MFIDRVRNGEEIVLFGDGVAVRDFVHVGDVVDVAGRLLGRGGPRVVNVGSGAGTSIRQLLELVERTLGRRARVIAEPARAFDVGTVVLDVSTLRSLIPTPLTLADGHRGAPPPFSNRCRARPPPCERLARTDAPSAPRGPRVAG